MLDVTVLISSNLSVDSTKSPTKILATRLAIKLLLLTLENVLPIALVLIPRKTRYADRTETLTETNAKLTVNRLRSLDNLHATNNSNVSVETESDLFAELMEICTKIVVI